MRIPLVVTSLLAVPLMGVWPGLAQPEGSLALILARPNREVQLELQAATGEFYRWEVSRDWVVWEPLTTWLGTGLDSHLDSAAPYHRSGFYRAIQLPESPLLTGDHLVTPVGSVVVHPVNHASLVLEWNGTLIYVDPVGGAAPFQGLPRADLILITHTHGDHFNSATIDAVRGSTAAIVAPLAVYNGLSAAQRPITTVLANESSVTLKGIEIHAVPAYNLTASNHPKGAGNGYVLTAGGRRLYVAGDTEDTPELRALEGIDVAFLPMNVPYTMTVAKAADAVRQFRPKVVYPYHYRNQNGTFSDLASFKQQVGTDLGIEVRLRDWY